MGQYANKMSRGYIEKTLLYGKQIKEDIEITASTQADQLCLEEKLRASSLKKSRFLRWCWACFKMPGKTRASYNVITELNWKIDRLSQTFFTADKINADEKLNAKYEQLARAYSALAQKNENLERLTQDYSNLARKNDTLEQLTQTYVALEQRYEKIEQLTQTYAALEQRYEKIEQLAQTCDSLQQEYDNLRVEIQRMRESQRLNRTALMNDKVAIVQYEDDLLLSVPASEWTLPMYFSRGGKFEVGTERFFQNTIKAGAVFVDVGAHVGIYTLHALRAGCETYSFEPTPATFEFLKNNVHINGFEPTGRAHLYNNAVSNTAGDITFQVSLISSQNNSIYSIDDESESVTVKAVTLDDVLSDIAKVDYVKIDVEGAEFSVLRGMEKVIQGNPQIEFIMEFSPSNLLRASVEPKELYEYWLRLGFNVNIIDALSGELTPVTSYEQLSGQLSANVYLNRPANKSQG